MARLLAPIMLLLALLGAAPALAVQPDEMLKDPVLEARARALSQELRCMVCQNQSIDDSDAPLARDLRILVRERLVAGDSDDPLELREIGALCGQIQWHHVKERVLNRGDDLLAAYDS